VEVLELHVMVLLEQLILAVEEAQDLVMPQVQMVDQV
jgi:hypothetical protein